MTGTVLRATISLCSVLVISFVGCSEKREVSRVRSPDGLLDAVHVQSSGGGATVGMFDDAYVQGTATDNRKLEVISGYRLGCLSLAWAANRKLLIKYSPLSEGSIGPMPADSAIPLPNSPAESLWVSYEAQPRSSCQG